jgi:5-methylthioadenosine/S-adenosylhomocysteine deaminase
MRRTLIKGAAIVSMDPAIGDLRKGDTLIEGDRIAAVAPNPCRRGPRQRFEEAGFH